MNYLTTNYREFIRHKLNNEMEKTEMNSITEINSNNGKMDWIQDLRIEFEKIMKESDEIYNAYWGKLH